MRYSCASRHWQFIKLCLVSNKCLCVTIAQNIKYLLCTFWQLGTEHLLALARMLGKDVCAWSDVSRPAVPSNSIRDAHYMNYLVHAMPADADPEHPKGAVSYSRGRHSQRAGAVATHDGL